MTEKQMAHMTPAQAAEKAIRKTLERIIEDPTIGYLFGVGTSTWSFLSEAYAMLQGVPVEDVRKNCIPKNAKDPKETYAPVPENSSNNFGEGHIPREGCPICGNDVEGARDLRDAVKDLVAIHASHLTPGPCHPRQQSTTYRRAARATGKGSKMITVHHLNFVWNPAEIKPLVPTPEGKVRIRIRPKEFTQAFVKTADGIKRYIVMDNGDTWTLGKCLGENRTLRVSVSPCEKSESEVAK